METKTYDVVSSVISPADNDLLRATVISLVPFEIHENKPGLIPGDFRIPAAINGEPEVLVVGECYHYVYIDEQRGQLRVRDASYDVARSIVHDYINGQLAATPTAHPAIFWRPGVYTKERAKKELVVELASVRNVQKAWFIELVKMADDDWEKTRQHWAISDTQRHAARDLGYERPYLLNVPKEPEVLIKIEECRACGSTIKSGIVVCPMCKAVLDPEKFKKFTFAGKE